MSTRTNETTEQTTGTKSEQPGILLRDGRLAVVVPALGRHIRQARRMAAEASHDYMFALIAQVATINGQAIVAEDLDAMPGADVVKLMEEVQGNLQ
ncbi:hypothetical protein GCM10027202_12570 [Microvirgula curvata]